MSSTYPHYTAPSSVSSDYGLIARFAANQNAPADVPDEEETDDIQGDLNDHNSSPHRAKHLTIHRASVLPSDYVTPFNPTMGPLPDEFGHRSGPHHTDPSESTPLLAPPVPRILEDCDETNPTALHTSFAMYKEELAILTKYTIPVYG